MHRSFWLLAVMMALAPAGSALAAPPPNANPAFSAWFGSLTDPETSVPCCSLTDCRMVEHRRVGDHFEAEVEGHWLSVPIEKVLHRTDNPTGQAVLCWSRVLGVLCFVPGAGT